VIGYTVTLVNLGPAVAQNVTLTDFISAGQTYAGSTGNNGTTSAATTASLAVGGTLTLVMNVQHHGHDGQHHQHGGGHVDHARQHAQQHGDGGGAGGWGWRT
jgi:uncharacterized repeat protein (TIGR01451 family)